LNPHFDAHKAIDEAQERHAHAASGAGSRWVPVAAAVLAVLAALTNMLSNQRATQALVAKNDAILAQSRASDQWNYYASRSIKEHIYDAAIDANPVTTAATRARLRGVAEHERTAKAPILEKARDYEREAAAANVASERKMSAYDTFEVAVTLFEIAIVVVSISALTASRMLAVAGALATAGGLVFLASGLAKP
jgi:hypothetical protein